jgi:L-methionine (R)-S-oxide reductase
VPDVEAFPGHIACDPASRAEIVVPLLRDPDSAPLGVLDVDSAELDRFDEADAEGLSAFVRHLLAACDLTALSI